MENITKSQVPNLEKVGQEIPQINTLFWQVHHTYKHIYITFLYEVSS